MNIETTKIGCIGPRPLFAIVHYNKDNDENTYFAGFNNEVQCLGTEDESQCWENEEWVDNQDGAFFFNTYNEAKDFLDNIDEDKRPDCKIILYGYSLKRGFDGCYYFPLKEFKV